MYPLAFASFVDANKSLISSNTPIYVAGLDLGVFPIGSWEILITLSIYSNPLICFTLPASYLPLFKVLYAFLYNTSVTKEDLPDPDTPVTKTNAPKGILTLTFFKLFASAPIISIKFPLPLFLKEE